MDHALTFGTWLRMQRRAQDLSREALAELVSCAAPTLAKIEQGTRRPSRELAALLLDALQTPPAERERALLLARQPLPPAAPALHPQEEGEQMSLLPALPAPPSPLVGRAAEMLLLRERLLAPDCRVVTLVGPGGVGKTRLALEVAALLAPHFPDGAAWVELAAVAGPEEVAHAIADTLACRLSGDQPSEPQLLASLRSRSLLLVLDNLEHLLGATPLLATILRAAPGVTLLLTSRQRLRLAGEWVVALDGLATPGERTADAIEGYDAVRLFLERARQADSRFASDTANAAAIATICRCLEGIPLAIELAAAWTRTLSCVEVAAELSRSSSLLVAPDTLPQRHSSMQMVFDQSWHLLAPAEQRALAALSLFRGGFTRRAAAQIADAPLPLLASLVEQSLVRRHEVGGQSRYTLHELVRQFAAERLAAAEEQRVRSAHATFYADMLAASLPALQGGGQLAALAALDHERANIAHAWSWLADGGDEVAMVRCAPALLLMHELRGRLAEAAALFGGAVARKRAARPQPAVAADRSLGILCAWEGWARGRHGEVAASHALLAEAVALLDGDDDLLAASGALGSLGLILLQRGSYAQSRAVLERSLALVVPRRLGFFATLHTVFLLNVLLAQGDILGASALGATAIAHAERSGSQRARLLAHCGAALAANAAGNLPQAQQLASAALPLAVAARDPFGLGLALLMLGMAARLGGELEQARYLLAESAEACGTLGDRWNQGRALVQLGIAAHAAGDDDAARAALHEALAVTLAHGIDGVAATAAVELAALAAASDPHRASSLLAALRARPETDSIARARIDAIWPTLAATTSPPAAADLSDMATLADLLGRYTITSPPSGLGIGDWGLGIRR